MITGRDAKVKVMREVRLGGTLTGQLLANRYKGKEAVEALMQLEFPKGWTRDITGASFLFRPLRGVMPCLKVTWAHGLCLEEQFVQGGKIVSRVRKGLTVAGLVATAELLLAAHD